MESKETPMEEICVPFKPGHVLMPNHRAFPDHVALCKKMHGRTGVIADRETHDMATRMVMRDKEACSCNLF